MQIEILTLSGGRIVLHRFSGVKSLYMDSRCQCQCYVTNFYHETCLNNLLQIDSEILKEMEQISIRLTATSV